jgi:hypothetical protein
MTPSHDAARRFVETFLRAAVQDLVDLTERHQGPYKTVEDVVREQESAPAVDLDALEAAVVAAVPTQYRAAVTAALVHLVNAYGDEIVVKSQASYAIGVAVGNSLSGVITRKASVR